MQGLSAKVKAIMADTSKNGEQRMADALQALADASDPETKYVSAQDVINDSSLSLAERARRAQKIIKARDATKAA